MESEGGRGIVGEIMVGKEVDMFYAIYEIEDE